MARVYHQGRFIPKNPAKYRGDATNIIYRSSWEKKFMLWCDRTDSVVGWSSEETVVPYICATDGRPHRYFIDFKVDIRNREGQLKTYLVEVKPLAQTQPPKKPKRVTKYYLEQVETYAKNISKWEYADKYATERGYKFLILTEESLGIK